MFIAATSLCKYKCLMFIAATSKTTMKTCPCNIYPLKPHFYMEKQGYAGVYLFFFYLLQYIDCGDWLEPSRRGGSNVYPQSIFEQNKKEYKMKKK